MPSVIHERYKHKFNYYMPSLQVFKARKNANG